MIVTITMNPAVDKSTSIDSLIPEKKLRCEDVRTEAGGGGINVSKAIKKLGGHSCALFPSGGLNGKLLEQFLTEEGISYKTISIEGETRESFTVNENRTAPGAQATGGTLTCIANSVQLGASSSTGGVTYSWSGPGGFNSALQNPTVSVTGTYTVTVTNPANGCTSTASAS